MDLPRTLSPGEAAAIRQFVPRARELLGTELRHVRLFGSRARGEGHEHSDLDIALIVASGGRARRYAVYDLAFDVGLEHSVRLAPLVLEEQQFQELIRRERLVALDIEREGIAL
jgi:uncharacterized protein